MPNLNSIRFVNYDFPLWFVLTFPQYHVFLHIATDFIF